MGGHRRKSKRSHLTYFRCDIEKLQHSAAILAPFDINFGVLLVFHQPILKITHVSTEKKMHLCWRKAIEEARLLSFLSLTESLTFHYHSLTQSLTHLYTASEFEGEALLVGSTNMTTLEGSRLGKLNFDGVPFG